jgi:hypothetical protein
MLPVGEEVRGTSEHGRARETVPACGFQKTIKRLDVSPVLEGGIGEPSTLGGATLKKEEKKLRVFLLLDLRQSE